jgi:hypothetical protein
MVTIIKKSAKKSEIDRILKSSKAKRPKKSLNALKYCGILKITENPVQIQKKLRNEWK